MKFGVLVLAACIAALSAGCTKQQLVTDKPWVDAASKVACIVAKMADTPDSATIAILCGAEQAFVDSVMGNVQAAVNRDRVGRAVRPTSSRFVAPTARDEFGTFILPGHQPIARRPVQ